MDNPKISPLAVVHPNAKLGKNVEIGPFAIVEDNVEIGDKTVLHPHAIVRWGARIGSNCQIHPGAVISGIPQDLKFVGEETLTHVGDNTVIRECATINRGTASKGYTKVGSNCLLMAYSHVAHDCELGNNIILGNATQVAGEVEVADHAIISGGVLVHQFVRIGCHVMIQGGSRVTKDIPPYSLIGREPICYCGINIVGLRRRGFTNDQIFLINDIYRTIYSKGLNTTDALEAIEKEYPETPERDAIYYFIKESKRGVVRGAMD